MKNLNDLYIGILGSLIASIVLFFIANYCVPFFKQYSFVCIFVCLIVGVFVFFLINLIRNKRMRSVLGIIGYYQTRETAIKKNVIFLKESSQIDTLNFKGYELIAGRNTFKTLAYQLAANPNIKIAMRCLLLNPNGSADKYIQKRIDQIREKTNPDVNYHKGKISETVKELKFINEQTNNISCQFFCEELKWSLIIADRFLLISFYKTEKSQIAPCLKIDKKSILGGVFVNHFEDLWETTKPFDAFAS